MQMPVPVVSWIFELTCFHEVLEHILVWIAGGFTEDHKFSINLASLETFDETKCHD